MNDNGRNCFGRTIQLPVHSRCWSSCLVEDGYRPSPTWSANNSEREDTQRRLCGNGGQEQSENIEEVKGKDGQKYLTMTPNSKFIIPGNSMSSWDMSLQEVLAGSPCRKPNWHTTRKHNWHAGLENEINNVIEMAEGIIKELVKKKQMAANNETFVHTPPFYAWGQDTLQCGQQWRFTWPCNYSVTCNLLYFPLWVSSNIPECILATAVYSWWYRSPLQHASDN